jgi:Tfp pilus assembly protein PilF
MLRFVVHTGWLVLVVAVVLGGCSRSDDRERPNEEAPEAIAFRNIGAEARFVGDEACFECHEEQYLGYQDHGMARSYYPLTDSNRVEQVQGVIIRDPRSDLVYTIVEIYGELYQEEYEESSGGPVNVLRRRIDFVVGSGTAARTYLTVNNGRLYQLPLTWYTQKARWDFSPGYRVVNHRFSRLVPDRCMACHNGYPEPVPFVEGKYGEVPNGIGCERCHGPGGLHVAERQEIPEPAFEIDDSIVNPAHLDLDRQLDVCQQCHLHTTVSILREGKDPFGFRPSQRLDGHIALFARAHGGSDEQIDVISHADRMKQSPCFTGMADTETPMQCTTCHNTHEGFRRQGVSYFNATCQGCHSPDTLRARLIGSATISDHETPSNCIDCHMPKVEVEDAPHSSFTDHKIRIVAEPDASQSVRSSTAEELEPYFARDHGTIDGTIYAAMANIIYGRQTARADMMRSGANELARLLEADTTRGEAHYLRGLAMHLLGDVDAAILSLEIAVRRDPNNPQRLNGLAQGYEAAGRSAVVVNRLYRRALAIQPAAAEIRVNYGRFLQGQSRLDEAEKEYRSAIQEDPWLTVAWHNLGTLQLSQGDIPAAEKSFRQAVHLDPFYADAIGNIAAIKASEGSEQEAEDLFERAVEVAPENRTALGNLGALRLNQGRLGQAINLLSRAVAKDSLFVDGLANLALAYFRADDPGRARSTAQRATLLDPSNALARQVLVATK